MTLKRSFFCQDEGYSSRRTGDRYSYSKETPLPTPTFKKNSWNKNNRRDDRSIRKDNTKASNDEGVLRISILLLNYDHYRFLIFMALDNLYTYLLQISVDDRSAWEEEQKRLDREWYGLDEGYDETNNPFSGVSAEYTK